MEREFLIPPAENMPLHWETLTKTDCEDYVNLRTSFQDRIKNKKKGESLDSFANNLIKIEKFIDRTSEDREKRAKVCGIVFSENEIAINIQQLRILLGKCKSSINGSLQQLGYTLLPQNVAADKELLDKMPFYLKDKGESKKWTIRCRKKEVMPLDNDSLVISLPPSTTAFEPDDQTGSIYPYPVKFRNKFYDPLTADL